VKPYYHDEESGITIYHGDCREILPKLRKEVFDLVLTDPPYGIKHKSHGQRFTRATEIEGDHSTALARWIMEWSEGTPLVMFFSPYAPLMGFRSVLCWSKGQHVGIGGDRATCWKRDFELIGVRDNKPLDGKRGSAVLPFMAHLPPPSGHVAEKPRSLISYLLGKLKAKSVIDPCMGSGTTLLAAKGLGIRAVGIEVEEKWCRYAAKKVSRGFSFYKGDK
jgi:DNA modification methylase